MTISRLQETLSAPHLSYRLKIEYLATLHPACLAELDPTQRSPFELSYVGPKNTLARGHRNLHCFAPTLNLFEGVYIPKSLVFRLVFG